MIEIFYTVVYILVLFVSVQHFQLAKSVNKLLAVSIDGDMGDTSEALARLKGLLPVAALCNPTRSVMLKMVRSSSDQGGVFRSGLQAFVVAILVASCVKIFVAVRGLFYIHTLLMFGGLAVSVAYATMTSRVRRS